mmetsp:Transcript_29471/g.32620  ORF Transcript_29471/g.32620 Transcript_29471/m.32620 type:complete len:339 (-) Transcript_29471:347-1363(-)
MMMKRGMEIKIQVKKNGRKSDVIQRLLKNTKRKSNIKIEVKKTNEESNSGDNNSIKPKKEIGIPRRKVSSADDAAIPRSKPSSKDGNPSLSSSSSKKKENNKTATPGLLTQSMLPAPSSVTPSNKSKLVSSRGGVRPNKANNNNKSGTQPLEGARSQQLSPVRIPDSPWENTTNNLLPPPQLLEEERRVLSTLKIFCSKLNLQMEPTDDLLSGSFLSNTPLIDWRDENNQARIPIFPEDFPPGGPKEWPLSWWGIVNDSVTTSRGDERESRKRVRSDRSGRSDRTYPPLNRWGEWYGPPHYEYPPYWGGAPPPYAGYMDRGGFPPDSRGRRGGLPPGR